MTTIPAGLALADARLQHAARLFGVQRRYFDLREYMRAKAEKLDLSENARLGVIFVHVPKCAGTSITRQVTIAHWHRSAQYYRWADPALFERAYTFGFVRNPHDRFVSAFHYLTSEDASARDKRFAAGALGAFKDFRAFAAALDTKGVRDRALGWLHFLPQTYFLCDAAGRVLVDYVGRTERFADDIDAINGATTLALENQRHRHVPREPFADFYTPATARLIADLYADDFERFGYPTDPF
ncbi:MAG: sulfotransferase family 2 domain-containing protein [Alphaproteobacteria bacterium]